MKCEKILTPKKHVGFFIYEKEEKTGFGEILTEKG